MNYDGFAVFISGTGENAEQDAFRDQREHGLNGKLKPGLSLPLHDHEGDVIGGAGALREFG